MQLNPKKTLEVFPIRSTKLMLQKADQVLLKLKNYFTKSTFSYF